MKYITGHHPTRELDTEDRENLAGEQVLVVRFPAGFETYDVAVVGDGLTSDDAIEAAIEWKRGETPDWVEDESNWEHYADEAFVTVGEKLGTETADA